MPEQTGFIVVADGQLIVVHHHVNNNNRMSGNPRWILMFRCICEVGSWHYASDLRNMVTIMTLYRDYVNNQEDLREVLDQLFQVNFVISLRIWIVRLQSCIATFSQKRRRVNSLSRRLNTRRGRLRCLLQASRSPPFANHCSALYSSHLKSKPSLSYLTNIRPWRL